MKKATIITRTVWLLSLVSLFTDMASEMLYPIMPIYLKSIGFSVVLIGVLEGFAEAISGLSKGYFGKLSDNFNKRLPFVQIGYSLSAISKPMLALFSYPIWVFSVRTIDRIGKGLRTGSRDAMLALESDKQNKGKIFGFHRSLDTIGAFIGPIAALVYLSYYPEDYKSLFYLAFIPGICAIGFTFFINEKKVEYSISPTKEKVTFLSFINYLKVSSSEYKKLFIGLLFFMLINSSDVFLLLMLKHQGIEDVSVIKIYIFYNLVYAIFAYPIGVLADKLGLKKIFIIGLLIFSIVYIGMVFSSDIFSFYLLFLFYGVFSACTEGVSKAWISNVCEKKDLGTAIGTFEAFKSVVALVASSLAGLIWYQFGAVYVFVFSGTGALIALFYFLRIPFQNTNQ